MALNLLQCRVWMRPNSRQIDIIDYGDFETCVQNLQKYKTWLLPKKPPSCCKCCPNHKCFPDFKDPLRPVRVDVSAHKNTKGMKRFQLSQIVFFLADFFFFSDKNKRQHQLFCYNHVPNTTLHNEPAVCRKHRCNETDVRAAFLNYMSNFTH